MRRSPQALTHEEIVDVLKKETRGVLSVNGDDWGNDEEDSDEEDYDDEEDFEQPLDEESCEPQEQEEDEVEIFDCLDNA
jgi:hypothetical protein